MTLLKKGFSFKEAPSWPYIPVAYKVGLASACSGYVTELLRVATKNAEGHTIVTFDAYYTVILSFVVLCAFSELFV